MNDFDTLRLSVAARLDKYHLSLIWLSTAIQMDKGVYRDTGSLSLAVTGRRRTASYERMLNEAKEVLDRYERDYASPRA